MESFVIEGNIPDERPYFVLLGDRSREMARHVADYVASLEPADPHPTHRPRKIGALSPSVWLAEHATGGPGDVAVVALLGPINAADEIQVELLRSGIGDRCLIVIDSEAEVQTDWKSVIKLPSTSSWGANWFKGLETLLTVLLLPAVDCGMARVDVAEVLNFLRGHWTYLVLSEAEPGEQLQDVMARAGQQLAMQEDCASFETLIAIVPTNPGILMKHIHGGITALRDTLPKLLSLIILPDHEEDGPNPVSLLAGFVPKRITAPD